jgi:BirA family biotin operon repressor/biotin-[acetyl-CoA-carboxylase] ligase
MAKIIGKKIIRHKEIDSTSDEARRLIKQGASEGTVIIAGSQTKGRGKPGSGWFSPPNYGIYLSVILRPFKNPKDLSSITIIGAKAVISMIQKEANLKAEIKLPNDVLINGKKVSGILTERDPSGNLIIGIGVNVNNPADSFPEDIKTTATSVMIEGGKDYNSEEFTRILIAELDQEYLAYLDKI